ncbi:hypothetical protein HYALB_00004682 [Hymenoscyphus albidus]|uniref:Nephrocystin 3-like N-terminal domain-containing protein n=1 Tax=Hymenoscyphus albidus TaxID=595503 RepID=A0A9N9LUI6_9HELO|nr:hypothetical protein HYALB_00004682 [Hymenoscyphus albidus]
MSTSEQGLVVVAPETEQSDYTIDIVAVPGLGADPKRSFMSDSESNSYSWLKDEKDGVLSTIPGARVMMYHYDSRWLGDGAISQTLYNAAALLLDSLVAKRNDQNRPLMFLAHSLGGLVVAKALILAVSEPERLDRMRIYESFAGGIFFGTPFGGSDEAGRACMVASILQTFKYGKNSALLQNLNPERDSLKELRRDFTKLISKAPSSSIACIYEQRNTNYVKVLGSRLSATTRTSALVVTEQSATLDGASEVRGMACDHRQLNRFDSAKDGRYEVVKVLLKSIEIKGRTVVNKRLKASKFSPIDDVTFGRLSDCLNLVPFRRERIKVESIGGDSRWILEEPKYLRWVSGGSVPGGSTCSPCLWISGCEGLGKSKAALAAVKALEDLEKARTTSEVMVAYFFCDSSPDSSNAENIVKSLMWQLILKQRSLAQHVKRFVSAKNVNSLSFSKLWRSLQDMLRDDACPSVYFVVNNVHFLPSDESTTLEFLGAIKELMDEEVNNPQDPAYTNVKWMILSRDRDYICQVLQRDDGSALRVNLEDGSKDAELRQMLRTDTKARVKALAELKGYSLSLQYFVTSILLQRADNNTRWVEVVCCLLERLPTNHVLVRKTLEELPQDVGKLMNQVWSKALNSEKEDNHTTKEILRTLAIAYEDPTLDELNVLAELSDAADAHETLELVKKCGPLLRIYDASVWGDLGSYRVTFIHEEAKNALLSKNLIGLSNHGNEVLWQHGIIALRSFSYTISQLQPAEEEITWAGSASDEEVDGETKELNSLFPEDAANNAEDDDMDASSLEYPVKYWLRHGNQASPDFVDSLDLKNAFWALESRVRRRWWNSYSRKEDGGMDELKGLTAMHIAAFFGLTPLINSLLADGHADEIFVCDTWDNQPLHWAAERGHVEVMQTLLDHKADMNNGEATGVWTPLHMAASSGQIKAMEFLMSGKNGKVNIDAVAKDDGTALTIALSRNYTKAAKLLLERGANATLMDGDAESPVAIAASWGHEDLIPLLLDKGGAKSLGSKEFGSAVAAAASAGHENIVRMLLPLETENLSRPERKASRQRALDEASKNGFYSIVKLLLETCPQRFSCDVGFAAAAPLGHILVLQELLKYNTHYKGTVVAQTTIDKALYMATDSEQEDIVEALLKYWGANPNAEGEEYGNAVTAAAFDGNDNILEKLVAFHADLNALSGYPLQAAASRGHLETVKLLLKHNASVNAYRPKSDDAYPLQAACVARQIAVARLLLEYGADPNLGGGSWTNPLIAAISNGLGDLTRLLLQKGANPNVFGGSDGSTPLINAAQSLRAEYLETLIQAGANFNQVDPDGDTALIISAYYGDKDCVRLLLDHGADINYPGPHNGSALHAAVTNGHIETCQMLLDRKADPTVRAGPHDTVVQAAIASGSKGCLEAVLGHVGLLRKKGSKLPKLSLKDLQKLKKKYHIDLEGGESGTALHAAATQYDDGCLRLLLRLKPQLHTVPPKKQNAGTALHAAVFAGCNRNARLLLEAGADPNYGAGQHGTILQAAALRCGPELCELLISKGAKIDAWPGKYGSALVAAVVSNYHGHGIETLQFLLEQEFSAEAYRLALEEAFDLKCRDAFKLIWQSIKDKGPKKLAIGMTQLLSRFQVRVRNRKVADIEEEDKNPDFEENVVYHWQYYEDSEPEVEEEEEIPAIENGSAGQTTRGVQEQATGDDTPDLSRTRDVNTQGQTSRSLAQSTPPPTRREMRRQQIVNNSAQTTRSGIVPMPVSAPVSGAELFNSDPAYRQVSQARGGEDGYDDYDDFENGTENINGDVSLTQQQTIRQTTNTEVSSAVLAGHGQAGSVNDESGGQDTMNSSEGDEDQVDGNHHQSDGAQVDEDDQGGQEQEEENSEPIQPEPVEDQSQEASSEFHQAEEHDEEHDVPVSPDIDTPTAEQYIQSDPETITVPYSEDISPSQQYEPPTPFPSTSQNISKKKKSSFGFNRLSRFLEPHEELVHQTYQDPIVPAPEETPKKSSFGLHRFSKFLGGDGAGDEEQVEVRDAVVGEEGEGGEIEDEVEDEAEDGVEDEPEDEPEEAYQQTDPYDQPYDPYGNRGY